MNPPLVLRAELAEGVFQLTLNRPEKRNALSIELRYELTENLRSLDVNPVCRAIVLTGNGPAFCAGMDFTHFGGGVDNTRAGSPGATRGRPRMMRGDERGKRHLFESTSGLFGTLVKMSKPVIAAVSGAAVGGGFMLAICCDERIASEDAFFGFFEVSRGIPAPLEVIRLYVGEVTAGDWCSTGRRISPEEAMSTGIVSKIVPAAELQPAALNAARTRGKTVHPKGFMEALGAEMEKFRAVLNLG